MSDVMCTVTNHEEKQAEMLFRVDSALLFVMSDVIFNVIDRDGSVARGTKPERLGLAGLLRRCRLCRARWSLNRKIAFEVCALCFADCLLCARFITSITSNQ
jgi:hypothetical protein